MISAARVTGLVIRPFRRRDPRQGRVLKKPLFSGSSMNFWAHVKTNIERPTFNIQRKTLSRVVKHVLTAEALRQSRAFRRPGSLAISDSSKRLSLSSDLSRPNNELPATASSLRRWMFVQAAAPQIIDEPFFAGTTSSRTARPKARRDR